MSDAHAQVLLARAEARDAGVRARLAGQPIDSNPGGKWKSAWEGGWEHTDCVELGHDQSVCCWDHDRHVGRGGRYYTVDGVQYGTCSACQHLAPPLPHYPYPIPRY